MSDKEDEARLRAKLGSQRWRLENLYYILPKQTDDEMGAQPILFKFNECQHEIMDNMWYLNLILKARQVGATTLIQLFILDVCLFNSNIKAGVIAHNKEDASKFFRDKIKFAYEHLPDWLKNEKKARNDRAQEYVFNNGSSISVGTSMRSGTLNYLHVSEFGKICAKRPETATEIVTGSLNTVAPGQFVFIESTAEGREGYFHDYCSAAEKRQAQGKKLTKMDYKFFFFAWWSEPGYRLDEEVLITDSEQSYFDELKNVHGIELDQQQKQWYVKKTETQGDFMKREYPSTPTEAFENSARGAYYIKEMARVRKENRILAVPHLPQYPVHAFFDLGRDDATAIWFMQEYNGFFHFIRYVEGSGENIQHYIKQMQGYSYVYGTIFLPHDGAVRDYTRADNKSRGEVVRSMGFRVDVVPKVPHKIEAIQAVRDILPRCIFDEQGTKDGITCLDAHRKDWNERYGAWRDTPFKGPAIHGADAFETFARGYFNSALEAQSFEPSEEDY